MAYPLHFRLRIDDVKPLVTDRLTQNQVVVAKSGNVYFQADNAAWVVPLQGGSARKLCDLPKRWSPGIGFTVNADETLLLGGSTDVEKEIAATLPTEQVRNGPNVLFTIEHPNGRTQNYPPRQQLVRPRPVLAH